MREWSERHIIELIDDELKKIKKPSGNNRLMYFMNLPAKLDKSRTVYNGNPPYFGQYFLGVGAEELDDGTVRVFMYLSEFAGSPAPSNHGRDIIIPANTKLGHAVTQPRDFNYNLSFDNGIEQLRDRLFETSEPDRLSHPVMNRSYLNSNNVLDRCLRKFNYGAVGYTGSVFLDDYKERYTGNYYIEGLPNYERWLEITTRQQITFEWKQMFVNGKPSTWYPYIPTDPSNYIWVLELGVLPSALQFYGDILM